MGHSRYETRSRRGGAQKRAWSYWEKPISPRVWPILFIVAGALAVLLLTFVRPISEGDGPEYYYTLQAFHQHGSPDLRSTDVSSAIPLLLESGLFDPGRDAYFGFWRAKNGLFFSQHFWMYPLLVLPAKALLRLLGANELAAFQITNAVLLLWALWVVLFRSRAPAAWRLLLAGLAAIGPALWYLRWPHPEVYTWSFVLISLSLLRDRRYFPAAVCASFAAMQNPPLLLLAGFVVALSLRERDLGRTLLAASGALLSLLPILFDLYFFGVPNVIVATGQTDFHLISWTRTWDFFADLNQGMLPYVPLLLLLAATALFQAMRRRDLVGIGTAVLILTMALLSETTLNWNSGCAWIMRYAVWIVPVLAWLVAEQMRPTARMTAMALVALAIQFGLVRWYRGPEDYVSLTPAAQLVLRYAPRCYNPAPEIFCQRVLHQAIDYRRALPVAYNTPDGIVTKILADETTLARLPDRYLVQPGYLEQVRRQLRGRSGVFYLTPPCGAVLARAASSGARVSSLPGG